MEKIWLSSPHMSGKEVLYTTDAIKSNWIAPLGPYVNKMEHVICEKIGVEDAALLSSGTAAIHLALKLLGVVEKDIVLCQSFTFSGSVNPILYEKAIPVFIDSEPETWNICPKLLENAIKYYVNKNIKPKAIIVVHLYGMPAKMDEIIALGHKYSIPIIEDAAEAIGSKYKNKYCGGFTNFGIYSFNGNKIITTSGGGALLSNNKEAITKAKFLASQAKDDLPHYEHSELGYNYRLSNISAAIGVAQLEVLDQRVQARRNNFNYYKESLKHLNSIIFQEESDDFYSNRWLTAIVIKNHPNSNEKIRTALEKLNIESRPLWKPMHLQPIFSKYNYFGNKISENFFKNGLCLPSGSNLKKHEIELVVKTIINTLQSNY